MTPEKAYEKLCNHFGKELQILACRKYNNFYGFYFTDKNSKGKVFVGCMTLVSRKTGDVLSEDDLPNPISAKEWWEDVDLSLFE